MATHDWKTRLPKKLSDLPNGAGHAALISAVLALALLAPTAPLHAEPSFSSAERAIIARNASLRASLARDPALVRRALDLMASRTRVLDIQPPGNRTRELPLPPQDDANFDTGSDPDLSDLQRASPEAAHDLFQLLKQVSSGTKRKESY